MNLAWRHATDSDLGLLAEWNHQLISDEGHRNQMTVEQLAVRLRKWLQGEYQAVLFVERSTSEAVAYALFKPEESSIYLRQFFVSRDRRRTGIGRRAIELLRQEVWPANARLTVDVLTRNAGGLAFWRRVGYADYCLTLEIMPNSGSGP
jgi:GNAT superfamily N-acetyltransferase